MSMKWMRGSYHYIMATKTWDHSSVLCWGWHLQLAEGWYGMVLLPYGHPPHIKHAKRLLYVWDGFGMSMTWMRGPYHYITVWYMSKIYTLTSHLQTWPRLLWRCGVRTQSYDCPPHMKYVKHLLYVWSGSGISIKWMGGPNHILQHVTCEKPTQNPRTLSKVMVWFGVVALWLPAMVEGF